MSEIKVMIIHHFDPFGSKIGGIASYIKGFIKYAPDDFEIKMIGITSDPKQRRAGRWHNLTLGGKKFSFYPLFSIKNENILTKIPLSAKFVLASMYHRLEVEDSILCFHRPELALPYFLNKNKKILYIHNDIAKAMKDQHTEVRWKYFPWMYFRLEKSIIPRMEKIYVVNRNAIQHYLSEFPQIKDRFQFLPTWADTEIFHPLSEPERENKRALFLEDKGFSTEDKLVVFVGRFEGPKSPLLLLDSFYCAFKNDSRLRLILIGEGRLKERIKQKIADLMISDRVFFTGSIPQQRVAEILQIADLFLLTSAFEGMPLAVLEALASGIPVVTTEAGEVKMVVRDGFSGRVVKERTPDAIGNAILEVLNGKDYSTKNCLISVADFTPQRVLKSVYDAMREMSRREK